MFLYCQQMSMNVQVVMVCVSKYVRTLMETTAVNVSLDTLQWKTTHSSVEVFAHMHHVIYT